ncbi:MAG TPA: hypothetical protein PKV73_10000 [Agriterribacter sp.]|nr:hypothetical protein [Agriterribacter sp.]
MAQENSPYSRYGLGDIVPGQNIVNRAMGGASAAYFDPVTVNFNNPASYARLKYTTFDVGLDYTGRTLKTSNPVRTLNSGYLIPSYVQVGFPLSKKNNWGMNIGMRPLTRINYEMQQSTRLSGIDSVLTSYSGQGGSYQAFIGTGIGSKHFTVGVNAGYAFGNKNYVTERRFINDSILYEKGKWADSTNFGGFFVHTGVQYSTRISKGYSLKLGAFAQLKNSLNASRNITRETFENSSTTEEIQVDSVYISRNNKGKIVVPATYGFGFTFEKDLAWSVSAEYSLSQWSDYRYYGQSDEVKDNWMLRVGGSFIPNYKSTGYWAQVQYRAGFYIGPDYVTVNNNLPAYAFTFGASFPVRKYGYSVYSGQYTSINTAFEIGARGNKSNSLRETFYRISVGLSLSDIWFIKRTYQ